MLQLDNLTLFLGDRPLLNGLNTIINPGERIGLVGPNGAGKSTLLKIVMGLRESDGGHIHLAGNETLGYLPQDGVEPDFELTVLEEVETVFRALFELEQRVHELQSMLEQTAHDHETYPKLLEQYGTQQSQLEHSGLYTLRSDIEKVLSGLGFSASDMQRKTTEFSGGWLMRIALAKLLLKKPTYLLLDEPTNHLDIESLQWMEQFLKNYAGAVVVVSHDRAFLDTLCTRTLALQSGNLRDYAGNYSFYESKWAEERELLINAQKNQEKQIKETEQFIERFRYKATKARQVQSRVKQLEKIDRIEIDDELSRVYFQFPEPPRSGQVVMKLEQLRKQYGEHVIFESLEYEIERGDKIAVVGPNGAGKSTLIRILAGFEPFQSGSRIDGHNVSVNYFAQHQADELDPKLDALETLMTAGSGEKESRLRTILGCFLFKGDDVFKKVSVLSGGERSRLALAKMLLSPANLLIFDEPTNHLDMSSKHILQQAIQQYAGTVVIVSHDRSFLDPIVSKVLEVQRNSVRTYLGNVSYFLDKKKEEEELKAAQEEAQPHASGDSHNGISRKEQRRLEAERRNALSSRVKPVKHKMAKLEHEIEQLEERKTEIETLMGSTEFYEDGDRVKTVTREYDTLKMELTNAYSKWEEYAQRLESIEAEL